VDYGTGVGGIAPREGRKEDEEIGGGGEWEKRLLKSRLISPSDGKRKRERI